MSVHDRSWRPFASDNYAGMLPEVLAAIGAETVATRAVHPNG